MPFASEFFDAIVSIDSFFYFGTDDLYLNDLARFVKPGGPIGIAGAGLMRELEDPMPSLGEWWAGRRGASTRRPGGSGTGAAPASWNGVADALTDGWRFWLDWLRLIAPDNVTEIRALGSGFRQPSRLRPSRRSPPRRGPTDGGGGINAGAIREKAVTARLG